MSEMASTIFQFLRQCECPFLSFTPISIYRASVNRKYKSSWKTRDLCHQCHA